MEITILTEEENPMLHRTDVRFRVSHAEASPERLAVRDSLAARLNKSADEVVIRSLDTKFGMRETIGEAKVYEAAAHARDVEQEYMLVRNKIGVDENGEADADGAAGASAEEAAEPADADAEPADDGGEPADAGAGADEDGAVEADADEGRTEADDEADAEAEEAG